MWCCSKKGTRDEKNSELIISRGDIVRMKRQQNIDHDALFNERREQYLVNYNLSRDSIKKLPGKKIEVLKRW